MLLPAAILASCAGLQAIELGKSACGLDKGPAGICEVKCQPRMNTDKHG